RLHDHGTGGADPADRRGAVPRGAAVAPPLRPGPRCAGRGQRHPAARGAVMAVDLKAAKAFAPDLQAVADQMPVYSDTPYAQYVVARNAAEKNIVALITAQGGKVRSSWEGTGVTIFGIRASST